MGIFTTERAPVDVEALGRLLPDLSNHPRLVDVHRQLKEAIDQQRDMDGRFTRAHVELTAAEHEAADGLSNTKRLQAAREQARNLESDKRIIDLRVERAREARKLTYSATCREVEQQFSEAHIVILEKLNGALADACRYSHEAAALEEASERVFVGGPYRSRDGLPGKPLLRLAWWKEFASAGHRGLAETRWGFWSHFWRKHYGLNVNE
jgi:hypothetical protein